jgi:hypothetical protein
MCYNVDDECLAHIARCCPHLLVLHLGSCWRITTEPLKQTLASCVHVREPISFAGVLL